ncbi:MAG: hypothetical protein OXH00_12880 [Candidatus Poribacteria bacterium]|nr:hypothetical protein [Candidatus Poribacteria bacterium]
MKMMQLLIFAILILLVLNVSVSPIFAKAPTTPKILFTSARDGNYEVYIMNPDGSEKVNLTRHHAHDLGAVWSPTGEQILFVSDRGGKRDLYFMNSDGTNVRRVFKSKTETRREDPTWSPDGKQIAYWYLNGKDGPSGVYIATLGKQDAEYFVLGSDPAWSPDGREIACGAAEPGRTWLILANVRTQKYARLLPKKALPWQRTPSWSATGDKLVFVGNNAPLPVIPELDLDNAKALHNAWKDKQTIFIVNRDGTGLQQLVDEAGEEVWAPEISPNGEQVLYTQRTNVENQIFELDVNSGIRTQLTHTSRNFGGDWFDPAYTLPVSPKPHLLTTTWADVKTHKPH